MKANMKKRILQVTSFVSIIVFAVVYWLSDHIWWRYYKDKIGLIDPKTTALYKGLSETVEGISFVFLIIGVVFFVFLIVYSKKNMRM